MKVHNNVFVMIFITKKSIEKVIVPIGRYEEVTNCRYCCEFSVYNNFNRAYDHYGTSQMDEDQVHPFIEVR